MHKLLSLAAAAIMAALIPASIGATSADHYTTNSKLSAGRWVKVRVTESGMQQITHEQLAAWGFDDPSKVTIHGHGGVTGYNEAINPTVPDDLPAQPVVYTSDRVIFYGEANARASFGYVWDSMRTSPIPIVQRNNVADAGYYFITDSQPVEGFETIPYSTGDPEISPLHFHYSLQFFEEEETNPYHGGQLYFGRDISDGSAIDLEFPVEDIYINPAQNDKTAEVGARYIVVGAGDFPYFQVRHTRKGALVNADINLSTPDKYHYFSTNASSYRQSLIVSYLEANDDTFKFKLGSKTSSNFSFAALDNIAFYYPRHNRLGSQSQLLMAMNSIQAGTIEVISDAKPGLMVWEVAEATKVRPYATNYDADNGVMTFCVDKSYSTASPTGSAYRAILFDPEMQQHAVEFAGEIANQNIHGNDVPELIILTSELCYDQAQRLADIHRTALKQDVLVLRQEEVFNEFSSGTPSLWGIRRMVKTFYDRGFDATNQTSKMRHLLLFGGGSYDNRALHAATKPYAESGALLLTFGTPDHDIMSFNTKSYASDCYFGFTDDSYYPTNYSKIRQNVNVGRIPALDLPKAITAVNKIEHHVTNLPTVDIAHRALIMTDFGDSNSHMLNGEGVANALQEYAPGITTVKGYAALYPDAKGGEYIRNFLAQTFKAGVGFMSYSGHGRPDAFSELSMWNLTMVNNAEYSFYPFGLLATCDAYSLDRQAVSMANEMVFKANGGLIAAIAACRTVYQTPNQTLNVEAAKVYAQADESTTTGDIYRIARNNIIAMGYDNQHIDNNMCYGLCGDPALPLYAAADYIRISTINGVDFTGDETYAIKPQQVNVVEGYVADRSDDTKVDENFSGTIILTLYESPINRLSYRHTTSRPSDEQLNILMDQDILAEVAAEVVNGRFTISFTPPIQSRDGEYNRMTLYAFSSDLQNFVKAYTTQTVVDPNEVPEEITDTEAPEITALYIDTPDFSSGDVVKGEFTVYANIAPDETGFCKSTASIGGSSRLIIDGSRVIPVSGTAVRSNADGTIDIIMPVTSMNDGRHSLTLTVVDNVGNANSATVEFTVINQPATVTLDIAEHPVTENATFDISHTFSGTPTGRLIIEDAAGRTVFSKENCTFPFDWTLVDNVGDDIEDGLYYAYVIMKSGLQYAASKPIEVVVICIN